MITTESMAISYLQGRIGGRSDDFFDSFRKCCWRSRFMTSRFRQRMALARRLLRPTTLFSVAEMSVEFILGLEGLLTVTALMTEINESIVSTGKVSFCFVFLTRLIVVKVLVAVIILTFRLRLLGRMLGFLIGRSRSILTGLVRRSLLSRPARKRIDVWSGVSSESVAASISRILLVRRLTWRTGPSGDL